VSVQYNSKIITDGLVLCLDAANPKSYGGSGTTWTDLSGLGNTGTLVNGVGYSSANKGSLSFDGSNDFIDFTSDSNLLPTNGLTVSAWFRTTVADRWLITKTSNPNVNGYLLAGGSNGAIGFAINNALVVVPNPITTGSWLYVAGTWAPSTSLLIYQNGIQVGSNITSIPSSIINPSYTLEIGRRPNGPDYWNGNISQVSIYNRALSASEIKQNYNATKSRYGL
jgi:hypothetical protein